jgi:hypothetical protein
MRALYQTQDSIGRSVIGLAPSDYINIADLVAGTAQTTAVPSNARHVSFSGTGDFWVGYYEDAAATATANSAGTGLELNPGVRTIGNRDGLIVPVLSLVSNYSCKVSLSYYGQ